MTVLQFGGLHGVGVTVVKFLSEWCEVDVSRDGFIYHQELPFPASMVQ